MTFEEALQHSIEQITSGFVRWRDHIKALDAEQVEKMKPFREQLEIFRAALLHKLQEQQINSAKADAGTVYISEVESFKVVDWEAFHAWVEELQEPDFLIKNVAGNKAKEWLAEHGSLPPGVTSSRATNLNVRS